MGRGFSSNPPRTLPFATALKLRKKRFERWLGFFGVWRIWSKDRTYWISPYALWEICEANWCQDFFQRTWSAYSSACLIATERWQAVTACKHGSALNTAVHKSIQHLYSWSDTCSPFSSVAHKNSWVNIQHPRVSKTHKHELGTCQHPRGSLKWVSHKINLIILIF